MAWYRCGGGSGQDRPIYKTVKLYQGKIAHSDGQVVEDTDYYYTDYFPMTTDLTFDMGYTTTSDNYVGVYMYKDDKSYVSNWYWNPTQRYRNLSSGQLSPMYESGARWIRVSFPANKLNYIMLHDWINGIMYSTEEVVRITDDTNLPLGTKTITANGTYSAQDDGVLGYSSVEVNTSTANEIIINHETYETLE